MEIALLSVKLLRWLSNFLSQLIRVLAGFFRLILGELFFKILVKIYHSLFRIKKNNLSDKTWREFLKEKRLYWFIVAIALILLVGNLINYSQAAALETKIPQTVMANLVSSEFSSLPVEELVEERVSPGALKTAGQEKYTSTACLLEKQSGVPGNETDDNNLPAFNDAGDLVYKPTAIGQTDANGAIAQRTAIVYYTVQSGDTVSSIAQRFGLTVNTILWANNLTARSLIQPGDSLTILPYSGVLYTVKSGDTVSRIAAKYDVEIDKILSCNDLASGLKAGQKIVVPGAKKLVETTAAPKTTTSRTGLDLLRNLVQSSPSANTGSGKMAWPTQGHRMSQYFSWRHPGVDIANKVGTPIYAADDGVVEISQSGWNGGYGLTIVINHGNGIKTRYGHASKLFVKVGDTVERGENIAAMGSTGRSTGSHLHFEVIVKGGKYNPLNYIR